MTGSTCIIKKKQKIEVIKQKGRSARFSSDSVKSYEVGDVDGCLLKASKEPKCDYFLRLPDKIWLVELKGKDVEHAVNQIVSTTHLIEDEIADRAVIAVIVASQCPAVSGQQKALRKLKNCKGRVPDGVVLKSRSANITF